MKAIGVGRLAGERTVATERPVDLEVLVAIELLAEIEQPATGRVVAEPAATVLVSKRELPATASL